MRLQLLLSSNTRPVPFNYNYELYKGIQEWLGAQNPWHGELSLYSIGHLRGGQARSGALSFADGAMLNINAWDRELLATLVDRMSGRPELAFGMQVKEVRIHMPPPIEARDLLWVDSPVLLKQKREGKPARHLTYHQQEEARTALTAALHRKMDAADCPDEWKKLSVSFDQSYRRAKTKLISVKGLSYKASVCPLIVEGPPEASAFLWSVGAGHNTGMGFGAIR
jgi:CRISPR-associated endoribonuclease Cas6